MAVQFNRRNWRLFSLFVILIIIVLLLLGSYDIKPIQFLFKISQNPSEQFIESSLIEQQNKWLYRSIELQKLLKCHNRSLRFTKVQHGSYWTVKNLIVGLQSRHMGCADSITYTTNGDFTFFDNLETVAMRWLAPISFAVYAPGHDMNSTLDAIQYVRNCLAGSHHIRDFVSFHVYFPNNHMPEYVPASEEEALKWNYSCVDEATGELLPPTFIEPRSSMYKAKANLTYPINVGRNIARQAVNTHFIFACDIELYPSLNFVEHFLDMVHQNHSVLALNLEQAPRVYPLPVFEISHTEHVPKDKAELLAMLNTKKAQLFHARICANCHKVPKHNEWLQELPKVKDELNLFSMTLRQGAFKYWEPFYVSDNKEPFFDERVTWEGQSNKRIQGLAMCLMGYEYHVLHPAFLVHSPGIKKSGQNVTRAKYAREMNRFIKSKIVPEYQVLYGTNKDCVT